MLDSLAQGFSRWRRRPDGDPAAARLAAGRALRLLSHPYFLFLLVALCTWWLDGFDIGPVNDGWTGLPGPPTFDLDLSTRPLQLIPRALGLMATPGSFVGWQSLLLSLTVLRGVLVFEIVVRLLPRHRLLAIACGLVAIFHPADRFYFWLDASNVDTAFVFALGACLAALLHLRSRSRSSLLALLSLQALCCLTYDAFLLLLIAFPVLVWIGYRIAGARPPVLFLFKSTLVVFLYIGFIAFMMLQGKGREARVVDLNVWATLAGYVFALKSMVQAPASIWGAASLRYLPYALLPAVIAYAATTRSAVSGVERRDSWYWEAGFVICLLILAGLAYLPYAVTDQRFGNNRELFAAGMLFYMAMLALVFFALSAWLTTPHPGRLLVALLALGTVLTGLESRVGWVESYRHEEGLLAAIAATVPDPPPGSVIVVKLQHGWQMPPLYGFYNRKEAFTNALRKMYGDYTLNGGFIDLMTWQPFAHFDAKGVEMSESIGSNRGLTAPYDHLLLLIYHPDGKAYWLRENWFKQYAPAGMDVSGYKVRDYGSAPGPGATTCTLLEKGFRPAYCR